MTLKRLPTCQHCNDSYDCHLVQLGTYPPKLARLCDACRIKYDNLATIRLMELSRRLLEEFILTPIDASFDEPGKSV